MANNTHDDPIPAATAPSVTQTRQPSRARRSRKSVPNNDAQHVPRPNGAVLQPPLMSISKTFSPQINDPVIFDGFVVDGMELLPVTPRPQVASTHTAFQDIIDAVFEH